MTPTNTPETVERMIAVGPFRVVRRHDIGGDRIWDVYGDHIGDYLATMNPTLPVSQLSTAERICASANANHRARLESKNG